MEEKFYNTKEVAEILGVTTRTVRNLCKARKIKYRHTTPRKIEISSIWLDEYLTTATVDPIMENDNTHNKGEE